MESGARKTPDLLIRGGILIDPETGRQRRADLLIRGGRIAGIAESIEADDVPVYDATGKFISPGWMDMHVHLREPGQEHKETIETGCRAAAFGGFTAVACMPNTDPPIHTRDVVEFVIERGRRTPVDVHPIACVSKNREGKELTEMADLVEGGAVAFSDDGSPVQHGGLMRRALEYASMLDRAIINHMEDLTLNPHGHMHEGVVSTRLGVPGIPSVAEEVMVARDLILAEYTGGHVHVAHISTARSVELVRQAKARGVRVTAEVCPHHFTLTDEAVERTGFSTNTPGVLTVAEAVYKLTVAPRRILRLPVPRLAEGEPANLTIFDTTTRWVFEERHIRSKSRNTPFLGEELIGRAWAIYNRGWFVPQEP